MTTNSYDISRLKRDENQNKLYDMFIQSYRALSKNLNFVIVERRYEMRLDFLCSDIYGDIKHLALLLKINDIFNPYSIKEGDLIFYVPSGRINDAFYTDPKLIEQDKTKLVNALKTATSDGNRQSFLNSLKVPPTLPPTITSGNSPKAVIDNNKIKIAPDLFDNPNKNTGYESDVDPNAYGLGDIFAGQNTSRTGTQTTTNQDQNSSTERVLVQTFVRSGNNTISSTDEEENNAS